MMENDTIPDMRSLFIKMMEDSSKTLEKVKTDVESSIANHTFLPLEAVEEDEENIIVKVVLPGVKKENIDIAVTENRLSVEATFDFENVMKGIYITLTDIKKGTIKRSVKLPEKVIPEQAKANLENGILKVEIPKQEQQEKFKVKID